MIKRIMYLLSILIIGITIVFSLKTFEDKTNKQANQSLSSRTEPNGINVNRSALNSIQVSRQNSSYAETIRDFHMKINYKQKGLIEINYNKNQNGQIDCHITENTSDSNESFDGQTAITYVESMMDELTFSPKTNKNDALTKIQNVLGIDLSRVKNLELFVQFENGKNLEIHENFKPRLK